MSNVNASDLQQSIFDAVDTIVSRRIKEIDYDKTIIGIIKSDAGVKNRHNVYKVEYAGGFFYAYVLDNTDVYIPNTKVYVSIPQGDFSKDKIIIGRADTINTSSNFSLVATAMSNYSILGKNALELKNENVTSAGVRSYHSKNNESDDDPLSHRYNILYGNENKEDDFVTIPDKNNLLTYAQEGTAIMVRADFRTDLSTEQRDQAGARYGLSFKLKFKNENAGWGETQGDILNNIGEEITEKIEIPGFFEPQSITLSNIVMENDKLINETLNEDNLNEIITAQDGELSQKICLIEELYRVFVANNSVDNLEIIEETFRAYDTLLKELQTYSNVNEIKKTYKDWQKVKVEAEEFKTIPCLLDSNKMLGAPLYFKKPTTQYAIFEADLTNFVGIEEIVLFKENFIENKDKDTKDDIFVENIQFLVLEPLDTISGDYTLKVESSTTGPVVSSTDDFVIFTATLNRKIYEDLSANSNTSFYWFREDPAVQTGSSGYHLYGGKGWYLLNSIKESKRIFKTTFEENPTKKNKYKCVVVYKENEDSNIILECPFIVYNTTQGELIELESDLGTVFEFDVGTPTITCFISGQETNTKKGNDDTIIADYEFYWSLITEDSQEILLYDNLVGNFNWTDLNLDDFSTYQMQETYLKNIKFFDATGAEISDSLKATRLQYPMVNINTGSKITIKCNVMSVSRDDPEERINQGSEELIFENRKSTAISGYRIVFEHDNQVFQYDEYGNSPAAQTKLTPQEILPIRAKLIGPNGLEISGTNIRVDWIFPIEDTMLLPVENSLAINPETGLANLLKNSNNCAFTITDTYNPDAINNQITCRINFKNNNYYKDTNLFFRKIGENGTNGTDIAVRIVPTSSSTILDEQPLTLYTFSNGESLKGFLNNNAYSSVNNATSEVVLTGEDGVQVQVYQKGQELNPSSYKSLWNLAGNPSEKTNTTSNIFNIKDESGQNNSIVWSATYTGRNPYRIQNIKNHVTITDAARVSRDYYGYYPLPMIEYQTTKPSSYANYRIAIDKKTYLKEILYNADGRNPIYSHNQGLKLVNLPLGSKVVWKAKGGRNTYENTPDFGLTFEKNDSIKNTNLSLTSENIDNDTQAFVYVVPNDETTGSSTNNRIEAEIWVDNILYAIVYAPIIITLDTFGLASLNAWDGNTVTIDEDGGYIMAPQIGAGEKDSNNRFTGIVMGKTETYTGGGDKEKEVGLFGYANGLQSIFLDANTGNATFGLPDVEVNGKYQHTSRTSSTDNYSEGRIELRPGGVSKIGGWRLGNRSIYYITDSSKKLKEVGSKYTDRWATKSEHEKDIDHNDQGILLNAAPLPYISIKGKPLTVGSGNNFDIDNSSGNAALASGDSLELVLDPNQKDFFTMFRHYKANNQWARTPLVGIDAMGRFYTNALKDKETSLNMNYVPGFGKSAVDEQYVGLFIGYGANTIIKNFISVNATDSSKMFISGGKLDNEYARPISIHGEYIELYAKDDDEDKKTSTSTDANIKISTHNYQTQLGNTQFKLTREDDNSLDTRGNLNINLGASNARKNFTLNAYDSTITLNGYSQTIQSGTNSNITINTTKNFYHMGEGKDIHFFTHQTKDTENKTVGDTKYPYLKLNGNERSVALGYKYDGNSNNSPMINRIVLDADQNGSWTTSGDLTFTGVDNLEIKMTRNFGDNTSFDATAPQILLQAGTGTENYPAARLFLNSRGTTTGSYTNSWFGVTRNKSNEDGIYLYNIVKTNEGSRARFHVVARETTLSEDLKVNGDINADNDINVGDNISVGNNISVGYEIDVPNSSRYKFENKAYIDQTGSRLNDGYYNSQNQWTWYTNKSLNGAYSATGTTLTDLIADCLKAANSAKTAADTAASSVTSLKNSLKSAAYKEASDFDAAGTAYGYVYDDQGHAKWATAGHTHTGYASSTHTHTLADHNIMAEGSTGAPYIMVNGTKYSLSGYTSLAALTVS